MLAPTPFNTARRETCFLNTYIANLRFLPTAGLPQPDRPTYRLLLRSAVELAGGAACGTRRILNCSLRTTAWTSAENR